MNRGQSTFQRRLRQSPIGPLGASPLRDSKSVEKARPGDDIIMRILGEKRGDYLHSSGIDLAAIGMMNNAQIDCLAGEFGATERDQVHAGVLLRALREAASDANSAIDKTEISISLREIAGLNRSDMKSLRTAKVFSFKQWLHKSEKLKVTTKTREIINSHARYSTIDVPSLLAEQFRQHGMASPLDLVSLQVSEVRGLARKLRIRQSELDQVIRRAISYRDRLMQFVRGTHIHQSVAHPVYASAQSASKCTTCSEHESVTSPFAYFVYLVNLTRLDLASLDSKLHQAFNLITPASGHDDASVRQLDICLDVLRRAYPGSPSYARQWRFRRHSLVAWLRLAPTTMAELFNIAASRLGYTGAGAVDFSVRFEAMLATSLSVQEPVLSEDEYSTLYILMEEMYLIRQLPYTGLTVPQLVMAAVQLNNTLDAASMSTRFEAAIGGSYSSNSETFIHVERMAMQSVLDQNLNDDGFRDLVDPMRAARIEAVSALRDAQKLHSGKTDRQLFAELFIETHLPDCEMITPLAQANRSLQAFLDHLYAVTTDQTERRQYEYLEYGDWRVSVMSQYYTELNALWKDDVLTGEAKPWDRGSILFDHVEHRSSLKANLAEVRAAMGSVLVNVGKSASYFYSNPELIQSDNNTEPFSRSVHYPKFVAGLDAIDAVLSADELIQQGLNELGIDEPGLAIDKYQQALERLDQVLSLLFDQDSPWHFDGRRGISVMRAMQQEHPRQYWLNLIHLYTELSAAPKKLFEDQTLEEAGWFTIDPDEWIFPPPGSFSDAGSGRVEHSRSAQNHLVKHHCFYNDGHSLRDYRFSARVRYSQGAESQYLSHGEELGIGTRKRGVTGNFRGYAAIVAARSISTSGGSSVTRDFFRLVKKSSDGGGTVLWESSDSVTLTPGVDYVFRLECESILEGNQVIGARLVASLSGTGASESSPEIVDDEPYLEGTFGFYTTAQVDAIYQPVLVEVIAPKQAAAPPFLAPRRASQESFHTLFEGAQAFVDHYHDGSALALDPTSLSILKEPGFSHFQKLAGLSTPVSNGFADQYLLFERDQRSVALDALDLLLEHLVMRSFYLRFAVLPVRLGQAYLHGGDYQSAAAFYHMVYDDEASLGGPPLAGFEDPSMKYPGLSRPPATLGQPISLDTKLMRLRLAELYLAWGDWLFQKNTDQSRYEARQLYERVLAMYGDSQHCDCFPSIGSAYESTILFPLSSSGPTDAQQFETFVDRFDTAERNGLNLAEYVHKLGQGDQSKAVRKNRSQRELERLDNYISGARSHIERNFTVDSLQSRSEAMLRAAEVDFLRQERQSLFFGFETSNFTILVPSIWFITLCIPENPVKAQHRRHACQMLELLGSCRNILGFDRDSRTHFRFEALLQYAQIHVELAKNAERDLLQFRRTFEAETFAEREAESNVLLSQAQLALENLNIEQSLGDVRSAVVQRQQTYHALAHYEGLIGEGWTTAEQIAFGTSAAGSAVSSISVLPSVIAAGLSMAGGVASLTAGGATASTGVGTPVGAAISTAGVLGSVAAGVGAIASSGQSIASALNSISSTASMYASFERRDQEWRYQRDQGRYALGSASQAVSQAVGRVDIARQSRLIASMRNDFALDTLSFLRFRFLNSAMWLWMQREVRKEYRTRLHYAVTVAHMAEAALAFETQEPSKKLIGFDYFDPARDGLLGATKLETDIASLRQRRLESEQRKLQLTKVISVARMLPVDFVQLKASGRLSFRSLERWFDEDFPGHYLRLIKSVRVTVMALTPPIGGLRATLSSSGVSVATLRKGGEFQSALVKRDPQTIAFTSPVSSNGLFYLQANDPLLLPFEGLGVETDWLLEIPKDTNAFDFSTIADVIIEIDYTALSSPSYRETVRERLGRFRLFDLPLSASIYFPDEWFHFHNSPPTDPVAGRRLNLDLAARYLPRNIDPSLCFVYHVSVVLSGSFTASEAQTIAPLIRLSTDNLNLNSSANPAGSEQSFATVVSQNGAILLSTHSAGNSLAGALIAQVKAVGQWLLIADATLEAEQDANGIFLRSKIKDIVLSLSIVGQIQ